AGADAGEGKEKAEKAEKKASQAEQFKAFVEETELVVRDLDLAKLREVRDRWQFYRDRNPGAYGPLTTP
ncbi:hypothetical protein ABZ476_30440, partial [Streptomyces albogriseolus]